MERNRSHLCYRKAELARMLGGLAAGEARAEVRPRIIRASSGGCWGTVGRGWAEDGGDFRIRNSRASWQPPRCGREDRLNLNPKAAVLDPHLAPITKSLPSREETQNCRLPTAQVKGRYEKPCLAGSVTIPNPPLLACHEI